MMAIKNIDSDYDQNPQNDKKAPESLKDWNRIWYSIGDFFSRVHSNKITNFIYFFLTKESSD